MLRTGNCRRRCIEWKPHAKAVHEIMIMMMTNDEKRVTQRIQEGKKCLLLQKTELGQ